VGYGIISYIQDVQRSCDWKVGVGQAYWKVGGHREWWHVCGSWGALPTFIRKIPTMMCVWCTIGMGLAGK